MYGHFMCIYVYVPYMYLMLTEVREGTRSSGTGDADGCELPCWGWELNPGPLAEQSVV